MAMYAAPSLASHFGYGDWSQTAKDVYLLFLVFAVVIGSAGAVVGGSFCYSLSRNR